MMSRIESPPNTAPQIGIYEVLPGKVSRSFPLASLGVLRERKPLGGK